MSSNQQGYHASISQLYAAVVNKALADVAPELSASGLDDIDVLALREVRVRG